MQHQETLEAFDHLKLNLTNIVNDWINEKKSLISSKTHIEYERVKALKKILTVQILKKIPEIHTEAGKIIQS